MKKSYQLSGYTLHVIPSKKFKNITMSLKLENILTKEIGRASCRERVLRLV